jgi:hypothetical protein
LRRVALGKGALQRREGATVRHALNGVDAFAVGLHRQHQAAPRDLAVD